LKDRIKVKGIVLVVQEYLILPRRCKDREYHLSQRSSGFPAVTSGGDYINKPLGGSTLIEERLQSLQGMRQILFAPIATVLMMSSSRLATGHLDHPEMVARSETMSASALVPPLLVWVSEVLAQR